MPTVSLVVTSYLNDDARRLDALLCLLYSVRAQTYRHWEVVVVHDGPVADPKVRAEVGRLDDPARPVRLIEPAARKGHFGHPYRLLGAGHARGDYVGLTNDDNYYAPVYFEWMVSAMQAKRARLAYCPMAHSHRQWAVIQPRPARGHVDVGNWLAAADLVKTTPWTDLGFAGDWTFFAAMLARGAKPVLVPGVLFVHN
jgi:glycosyltransferase involved in cell wall biosynthesis